MNGGPFRAPQPNEGGMINNNRHTSTSAPSRQPEEPRPATPEQPQSAAVSHRAPTKPSPVKEKKSKKGLVAVIATVIGIAVLAVFVGFFLSARGSSISSEIDSGKYQAVFFTNGQVYFGKLVQVNDSYFRLTDVFYLQAKDATGESDKLQQTTNSSSNDVQLIKLGNEIHGPQDEMVISKDQVLFFENLKAEGKVSTSIEQYSKTNAK